MTYNKPSRGLSFYYCNTALGHDVTFPRKTQNVIVLSCKRKGLVPIERLYASDEGPLWGEGLSLQPGNHVTRKIFSVFLSISETPTSLEDLKRD